METGLYLFDEPLLLHDVQVRALLLLEKLRWQNLTAK